MNDLYRRACRAHAAWEQQQGYVQQQPAEDLSTVEPGREVLENVNGVLARYDLDKGRLRRTS